MTCNPNYDACSVVGEGQQFNGVCSVENIKFSFILKNKNPN